MGVSERLYAGLLRAYPRAYRNRYAGPMRQLFRDRLREARTPLSFGRLWGQTLLDWSLSVPREYWDGIWPHLRPSLHDDAARRCISFARYEASSFSRREITPEHLLLGILRQEPDLVADADSVVREIEAQQQVARRIAPEEDLRLSRETIRVWIAAAAVARREGRQQATPRDLVSAILRERDIFAARLLRRRLPNGGSLPG